MSEYSKENLLIRPGAGEKSGSHLFVKVHASQLNNEYSVMEGTMEPGSLLAPHTHQREDQVVVILTSELEFQVGGEGGERFTAPAGSYVIKPRAIEHTFWNATNEPSRYIELSGGAGFQGFVDLTTEVGSLRAALRAEEEFAVEWNYARIPRLMVEHRLTSISGLDMPWDQIKDKPTTEIIETVKANLKGAIG